MAKFTLDEIFGEIDAQAPKLGIDPVWAKAFLTAENTGSGDPTKHKSFSGDAVSPVGAQGLMQVMPTTARGLQKAGFLPPDWTHDPENKTSQVQAGLGAMKEMMGRMRNPSDIFELGAMYNGGNYNHKQYLEGKELSPETAGYLPKLKTAMSKLGGNMTPQQIERSAASQPPATRTAPSGNGTLTAQNWSNSTKTSSYDPAAMESFQKSSGILDMLLDSTSQQVQDNQIAANGIAAGLMESIAAMGQASGASAQAQAEVQAAQAARRGLLLTKANLNPDQNNNRAQIALDKLDATNASLDAQRPEIDRRMAVGFFDNPVEYLINAVTLPGMVSKYNQDVQIQKDALGTYKAATEIANTDITMSQAIDADLISKAGVAQAAEAASKAQVMLKEQQLKNQGANTATALTLVQLANNDNQRKLQQLQLTRQTETENQGLTERQIAAKASENDRISVNKIIEAAGGVGIDESRWKSYPAAIKTALTTATSRGTFGKNFAEAAEFVKEFGSKEVMAKGGQLAVVKWLNDTQLEASKITTEQAKEAAGNGLKANKSFNPEKQNQANMEAIASRYQAAAAVDMRGEKEGNPYKIDYVNASKDPKFNGNVWAENIRKYGPGGPEAVYETIDEQQLLKKATMDIALSKDPAMAVKKYAADISSYYKQATMDQALLSKWPMFGLERPAKTYPVSTPLFNKSTKTTDLGDPLQVENVLTKQLAFMRLNALSGNQLDSPFVFR